MNPPKTFFYLIVLLPLFLVAQTSYQIDVTTAETGVLRGHLDLGGKDNRGNSIEVTSYYLEKNGRPFIPVIGEFHFSRYPHQYWEESIRKMKAGGITLVATYVFWNMHEFVEGSFDWEGDLNLRRFVELCAKNEMEVVVRVGPFCHGEMRNGGIPDWLYGRPIDIRSNDPDYLFYVNRLYGEIGKQLKGLFFKDGGPIVGVQLENEYQHSAAPWGFTYKGAPRDNTVARSDRDITQIGVGVNADGNAYAGVGGEHMKTLKQMAIDAGLVAPLYTATGWGFATIVEKGSIPVMAGYAYPFWTDGNEPSPFYLYKNIHQQPDYSPVSYDVNLYPSMAVELGTGMAVTYSRRPRVPGESMLPMMVRTVGSGTNGLGFYMYHGGTTPSIGNYYFAEGFGLNNKSYDYQAPIGEFGRVSSGFHGLKLINSFLKHYGSDLAPLHTVLPATNEGIKPENTSVLRYAVRSDGNTGYLFMHNFQDHMVTPDLGNLQVSIQTKSGVVTIPSSGTFTLKSGTSAIFPVNTSYDGVEVRAATVQPYLRFVNNNKAYHVFISMDGIAPELMVKKGARVSGREIKKTVKDDQQIISLPQGKAAELVIDGITFLVLPFEMALQSYVVGSSNQYLVISSALVTEENGKPVLTTCTPATTLAVYPSRAKVSAGTAQPRAEKSASPLFGQWKLNVAKAVPGLKLEQVFDRNFVLNGAEIDWSGINDIFVTFDYRGDRGVCMMQGILQTDNLYTSRPWTIGLKRFAEALRRHEMYFYFVPMQKNAPYLSYLDKEVVPDFGTQKEFLEIKEPIIEVEYKIDLEIR